MNKTYINRMPSAVGIPLHRFSVSRGEGVLHLRDDDTGAEYKWPYVTRSEQRFAAHLLSKLFNGDVVRDIIIHRERVWTVLPPDLFGGYLPPEYRAVRTKRPFIERFLKMFKKENRRDWRNA